MGGASYGRDIQQGGSLTRVTRAAPHDLGLVIHNLSPRFPLKVGSSGVVHGSDSLFDRIGGERLPTGCTISGH